jgi:hypothetical protein
MTKSSAYDDDDDDDLQCDCLDLLISIDKPLYIEFIPFLIQSYTLHHSQPKDEMAEYFLWIESIIEVYIIEDNTEIDKNTLWEDQLLVFVFIMIEISQPIRKMILGCDYHSFAIQLSKSLWRPLIPTIICNPTNVFIPICTSIADQIRKTYMEYNIRREISCKNSISGFSSPSTWIDD